jgi:DNA invertase Pin-like site-specific DNA recombinase
MQEYKKRFAIYARTATVQEIGPNFALAEQVHLCKENGLSKGYKLAEDQIYQEVASGASSKRPCLDAVLKAAEEGKFDILIIRDYACLARNHDLLQELIRLFADMEIKVESATEPEGVIDIAAAVMEVERIQKERFTSRMLAGKRAKQNLRSSGFDSNPDEASVLQQIIHQTIEE